MTLYQTPPFIVKNRFAAWENSPFTLGSDLYRVGFQRTLTGTGGSSVIFEKYEPTLKVFYLVGSIPWDRYLGSAFVNPSNGKLYLTGTSDVSVTQNSVYIREVDPSTWTWAAAEVLVKTAPAGKKYYNTSLCAGVIGGVSKFVMAIECDEGVPFSFRFVQSTDMVNWSFVGGLVNSGYYSACPTIRYGENGWFMLAFMFQDSGKFVNAFVRTNDFINVQGHGGLTGLTPYQQLMAPAAGEGINNSDIDFVEWNGQVYFTYLTGDQQTWTFANDAWYQGTLLDFYHEYWV